MFLDEAEYSIQLQPGSSRCPQFDMGDLGSIICSDRKHRSYRKLNGHAGLTCLSHRGGHDINLVCTHIRTSNEPVVQRPGIPFTIKFTYYLKIHCSGSRRINLMSNVCRGRVRLPCWRRRLQRCSYSQLVTEFLNGASKIWFKNFLGPFYNQQVSSPPIGMLSRDVKLRICHFSEGRCWNSS